jgi:hypothetical protein
MSDNYEDILNRSWDEIPEVQALPVGSYLLRARNASYQPAKDADKSPVVLFVYQVKEPMDDVDTAELAALGDNYDIGENKIFHRMYVDDNAAWDAVRQHLAKHGISGGTIAESLKAFKGQEVIAYLSQRQYTDAAGEQKVQNNAGPFAAVE